MIKATHRICHNVVSLYKDADSSSEVVSQSIWGASVEVVSTANGFTLILTEDLYRGWIRDRFIELIIDDSDSAVSTIASLFAEVYRKPDVSSDLITRLTTGSRIVISRLPSVGRFVPVHISDGNVGYIHEAHLSMTYSEPLPNANDLLVSTPQVNAKVVRHILKRISESAGLFIGVPYQWGGTTPFGLDCSGFTQLVYKINGLQLLRDASLQWGDRRFDVSADQSDGLDSTKIQSGDLVFFGTQQRNKTSVTHVGIAVRSMNFIHSAGEGRGNIVSECRDREFSAIFLGARRLRSSGDLTIDSA